MLLWYLAERWGRVTANGIVLALPLPHRLLADLVAARRPHVTTSLGALRRSGEMVRREDGLWVLHGDPPRQLADLLLVATGRPVGR